MGRRHCSFSFRSPFPFIGVRPANVGVGRFLALEITEERPLVAGEKHVVSLPLRREMELRLDDENVLRRNEFGEDAADQLVRTEPQDGRH